MIMRSIFFNSFKGFYSSLFILSFLFLFSFLDLFHRLINVLKPEITNCCVIFFTACSIHDGDSTFHGMTITFIDFGVNVSFEPFDFICNQYLSNSASE